jgi:hypothetical protein
MPHSAKNGFFEVGFHIPKNAIAAPNCNQNNLLLDISKQIIVKNKIYIKAELISIFSLKLDRDTCEET